ncbi:malonyl-CoA decarboxylase [Methylovirgula sp. 4M-Z18]|uniref:malonyl-CoA decarboxylase n=1 Tax=Methylovirgula sp. 4M-Z18 TaxID=2293567 RepID=UPI000E2FF0C9|nr:malonyl-CoA decarboxylase [Methylovirgula sp. 4M-Z18]RFB81068.1 MCD, Malonyl-CoA decarboxylase MCD [Methylovirgula sp. 4M-Z18]
METTFFLSGLLQTVADRGRALVGLARESVASPEVILRRAEQLVSGRGEATGVALAADVLAAYGNLDAAGKMRVLTEFNSRFGPDLARLTMAATDYLAEPDLTRAGALSAAAEPRRQELIRRLNLAPGGTPALVRMREDVQAQLGERPDLKALDADFVHLFSSWFNRGFLVLRRIDWSTPANILEKIIRYEAVHAIESWDDLRRRLEPPDRRLYGFFHPALIDEPLIFVEVALTDEIPAAIAPLLAPKRAELPMNEATTAVFYSISNAQRGLAGVSFGNFLIKQVVEELKRELPKLDTFVTLSPVPGFAKWLETVRKGETDLPKADRRALALMDKSGWQQKSGAVEAVSRVLLPLAAHYFTKARDARDRVIDPVARFHLGNGARLERLNMLGDMSKKGLQQSHGLMVNYLYALGDIEKNHEAYANKNEVVTAPAVRKLARTAFKNN